MKPWKGERNRRFSGMGQLHIPDVMWVVGNAPVAEKGPHVCLIANGFERPLFGILVDAVFPFLTGATGFMAAHFYLFCRLIRRLIPL